MDQGINLIPEQDMVRNLPNETRRKICEKLDIAMPFENDCRGLADKIGMSNQQIKTIWRGKGDGKVLNPTDQVLELWQVKKDATVRRLVKILSDLERDDVVEIIMERFQPGTAIITGNVCQFKCSNFSLFYFPFSPYLQSTQNVCKQ